MNTPRAFLLHCTFLLSLLHAPAAHAAEPTAEERVRAAELYENAAILYEEGSYDAAIIAFRASLALSGEPALHYNIASCLERLGLWEEALAELNLYRAFAPSEERERLERRMRMLEDKLAEARASAPPPTATTTTVATPPPQEVTTTPLPEPRRHPRWGLVGVGVGVGVLGGAGATISWLDAEREREQENLEEYTLNRQINLVSWSIVGVGALTTTLGLVIPVQTAGGELLLGPGGATFIW